MEINAFIQLCSAYTGFFSATFFALGVITQTPKIMLEQSQSFWDLNPVLVKGLSNQKAQYSIGVNGLLLTFILQALSFMIPANIPYYVNLSGGQAFIVMAPVFSLLFVLLRRHSEKLSKQYENEIMSLFQKEQDELPGTPS